MTNDPLENIIEFNRQIDQAHGEFIAHELTEGRRDPLALQAGRFNQFIQNNYPDLGIIIGPDLCETYLRGIEPLQHETGARSKAELTDKIHALELRIAYKEFRKLYCFKGSLSAEEIAFQQFGMQKHPELGPISDQEAKSTVQHERQEKYVNMSLGSLSLASLTFLVGSFIHNMGRDNDGRKATVASPQAVKRAIEGKDTKWLYKQRPRGEYNDRDNAR